MSSRLEQIWFKASKYKEKKTIKNKDGEETTVYEYSDRQVNKRHKEKSEKVEKIRQNIDNLEKKIYSDLKGKENREVALAVALINHTYERVGNDESASNGHYGVTGWKKKHLSFKGDTATLKYTGKSGVRHEKEITDKKLVSALKEVSKGLSKEDCLLEDISASDVNEYLKQFGITAKDIRGYHANREMQERLKALREENGELPKNRKEKEQQLKDEFKEALEGAAKAVGHEEATLRKQYLVPHLEETYMKDGTVITTLKKQSSIPSRNKGGDCYEANCRYFLELCTSEKYVTEWKGYKIIDCPYVLVHAEVTGQGAIEGINYGHAFILKGNTVIDVSNGQRIEMPKAVYFALGNIERNNNIHYYNWDQIRDNIQEFEHWGPWHLETSTGY